MTNNPSKQIVDINKIKNSINTNTREITIDEIEKELGYEIKIIK